MSEVQRSRMLSSAVEVVAEHGYEQMSVARVTRRARLSRRTFYELFENRADCFLAAFDDAVEELASLMSDAFAGGRSWRNGARAALAALLGFLDERPGVRTLLIVDALGAGPMVLERRAQVLGVVEDVVDRGRLEGRLGGLAPASLTARGVVGAVFSVLHARVLEDRPEPLLELLNPLMGMIVLPYLGASAAQKELGHPTPAPAPAVESNGWVRPAKDPLVGLKMRLTYRTLRVLSVIAAQPAASNREVADAADISDQGQISKLLGRLERIGLLQNTSQGHASGAPNAWRLTAHGEEVQRATRVQPAPSDRSSHKRGDAH